MNQENLEVKLLELLQLMKTANPQQKGQIVRDALKITFTEIYQLPILIKVIKGEKYSEETKLEALHIIEYHFQEHEIWNSYAIQIIQENMKLLQLVKICSNSYKLTKKYSKMLISFYRTYKLKEYLCAQEIQYLFRDKSYHIKHGLTILLSFFEIRRYSFAQRIFSQIHKIIQEYDDPSIRYLVIKVLWKIFRPESYCLNSYISYMPFVIQPFVIQLMLSRNQQFDATVEKLQETERYTNKFYYHKSKKWATRLYLEFLHNHSWKNIYCLPNICRIIEQLSIQTLAKTKHFQLQVVCLIIKNYSKHLKIYSEILVYELLPRIYNNITQKNNAQANPRKKLQEIIKKREDQRSETSSNPEFINLSTRILQIYICYLNTALTNGENIITFLQDIQTKIQCLEQEQNYIEMWLRILFRTKTLLNSGRYRYSESNEKANSILMALIQNSTLINSKYQNIRSYHFSLMTVIDNISAQTFDFFVKQCFHCLKQEENILMRYYASISLSWILTNHQYSHQLLNPVDYHQITLKIIDWILKDGEKEQSCRLIQKFIIKNLLSLDFSAKLVIQLVRIFKIYKQKTNKTENQLLQPHFNMCRQCQILIGTVLKNYKQIELQSIEAALFEDNLYILNLHLELKNQITTISQFYFQLIIYKLVGSKRYFSLFDFEQYSNEIVTSGHKLYHLQSMFIVLLTFLRVSHRQYDAANFQEKVVCNIMKLSQVIFQCDVRQEIAYVLQLFTRSYALEIVVSLYAIQELTKLIQLANDSQNTIVNQNQKTIEKIINLAYTDIDQQIQIAAIPLATIYLQNNSTFMQQHKWQLKKYLDNILTYKNKLNIGESVRILSGVNYLLENYQKIQKSTIICERLLKAADALLQNITVTKQNVQDSNSDSGRSSISESKINRSRDAFDPQNGQNIAELKEMAIQDFKKQINLIRFHSPQSFYRLTEALNQKERSIIQRYINISRL